MVQDVSRDTSQPRGHVQDARLGRRIQAGTHLELAKDCRLPVLVQLAIRALEIRGIGVGLVKSHTSRERLAKAGDQGGGGQLGGAGRWHRALAAVRQRRTFWRRRRFRVFIGSGGSRVPGGAAEEGVDLGEISDAIVCHSEVSLKLGYSGTEDEVLSFCYRRLRFAGGAGHLAGIFLKAVFRLFEGRIGCFEFKFEGAHAGQGAS